jgi:hypothetical protein
MVLNGDSMVVNGHFPVAKMVNFPILNLYSYGIDGPFSSMIL